MPASRIASHSSAVKMPSPASNASIALLNSSVVWAWTLSPDATMVNPLGRIKSQSEGVSKTEGERYPMRAFQPDIKCPVFLLSGVFLPGHLLARAAQDREGWDGGGKA